MNEIAALSNDITTITAEINSYKQVAGQAIFEIGKRLKHVKENDLVHGEWSSWCKEEIEMDRSQADKFIRVVDELGDEYTYTQLGMNALYQIATLPEPEREKEHTLSSGETKTPDEMTVRELQEIKRQLKQSQESERIAIQQLEEAEDKEPEVVEKVVEIKVVPEDYDKIKGGYSVLEGTASRYKEQNDELRAELKELGDALRSKQSNGVGEDEVEQLLEKKGSLEALLDTSYKLHGLQTDAERFLSVLSPSEHTIDFDKLKNETDLLDTFNNTLTGIEKWCEIMRDKLPNQNIIEGEFKNV